MRWVALILLLLNVGLFGYFKLGADSVVEVQAGHEPIAPDDIRLLTPDELDRLPKKQKPVATAPTPAAPPPPQTACYEWGSFAAANVPRARNILDKFSLHADVHQTGSQEATRYWVYIPPLATPDKAQAKNAEVRALGVDESFVVQEPQWHNAISFGVFKDESLATKLLNDLHAKGVKSAVKGVRNHENGQSSFLIRDVTEAVASDIGNLQPDFPGSELKKVTCP